MRYRAFAFILLCAALHLSPTAWAGLRIEDGRLVDGGRPVFLRGAMYYQPHAFHHVFWEDLDQAMVERDFAAMAAQGFNLVMVQVNWGSFMPAVDADARRYQWDFEAQRKLVHLLETADRHGLYVSLWFGFSRLPAGVNASAHAAFRDLGGREHAAYHGWLLGDWPAIADYDTYAWQALLRFHERAARVCRGFDHVIFDPLDWQHLNLNHWNFNDPLNLRSWRDFLRRGHPDLAHWNARWGEGNASWEEVLLPVDSWARDSIGRLPGTPYHDLPEIPYDAPKWQDFNRWHNPLFIRIVEDITRALRRGHPQALIMQRVDPWRFGYWREMTWGVGEVDFYAHGWYPNSPEEAAEAGAHLAREMAPLRTRAARPKPILVWEVGIDVSALYPDHSPAERNRHRAEHVRRVEAFSSEQDTLGWAWWVWRDHYMNEEALHWGMVGLDGRPKSPQAMPAAALAVSPE